ncbi:hypothetical protein EI546_11435 [Aequorivita sp. H23M31]|uniref:Uncharacterized protein n=1 Tax=Aequorivita ciconiae TaxID=2494375 RepID=A0A410G4U8_9FLAO|nr:hypothetical protein [Aequorivita sp. H23M31]QAA82293.1 hypothetical protein EI546_11435 [Aequorivita sp. H23M31]
MKRYSSFDEIDRDLKYLRLKSKIDKEEFKLGLRKSRNIISETFSPLNLLTSLASSLIKKAFYFKLLDKIVGITSHRK